MQYIPILVAAVSVAFVILARSLLLSAAAMRQALDETPAEQRTTELFRFGEIAMQAMTGAGALLLSLALLQLLALAAYTIGELVQFTRGL